MKKIIFLLFPLLTLAQNPTNFPYGIKNPAATSDSAPAYFTTTQVDGVHKKTPAALVAKVAIVNDSLATKENVANKSDSYTSSSSTTYASTKAVVDGLATKISGTGTINTIPKFTASGTIGNSLIQDDGTDIGIGGISTGSKLNVNGNIVAGNGDRTGKSVFPLYLSSSNSLGWKAADGTGLSKFEMYAGFSGINELRLLNSMKIIGSGQNLTLGTTNSTASITVANTTLGSVLLKTTTDDGINTLQVNGSTKTTALTLTTNPTTSASTYDFLTRNTSNGVVEKVLSNTIAMIASPAFTGTPTAPTATVGTNTTQIATTAFVQETKKITVRKVSTNITLADSDNATVILLTASATITLPNGLMNGFNASFATQTGATLTYSLGGSVVLINNALTSMPELSSHTIVNTGVANEYLTVGL